jgi:putative transposase
MNRAAGNLVLFEKPGDYDAFERVLAEARRRTGTRLCSYALMPNHFHLVLWPREDGELSAFMQWLTMTHTQRWRAHRKNAGWGHLYQSRFKSFPIQQDAHFLTVCRYVERNPLRARLVRRAENWQWCALACRYRRPVEDGLVVDKWPILPPNDWCAQVNEPLTGAELDALRQCARRGQPFGGPGWVKRTADALGLESTLRPVGRPPRAKEAPA